ncbi:hypothetical protein EDD11_010143 [Mortierella claussenii]|nr:hypothetical protein EDD11_010143 [Mortierella claussenii]
MGLDFWLSPYTANKTHKITTIYQVQGQPVQPPVQPGQPGYPVHLVQPAQVIQHQQQQQIFHHHHYQQQPVQYAYQQQLAQVPPSPHIHFLQQQQQNDVQQVYYQQAPTTPQMQYQHPYQQQHQHQPTPMVPAQHAQYQQQYPSPTPASAGTPYLHNQQQHQYPPPMSVPSTPFMDAHPSPLPAYSSPAPGHSTLLAQPFYHEKYPPLPDPEPSTTDAVGYNPYNDMKPQVYPAVPVTKTTIPPPMRMPSPVPIKVSSLKPDPEKHTPVSVQHQQPASNVTVVNATPSGPRYPQMASNVVRNPQTFDDSFAALTVSTNTADADGGRRHSRAPHALASTPVQVSSRPSPAVPSHHVAAASGSSSSVSTFSTSSGAGSHAQPAPGPSISTSSSTIMVSQASVHAAMSPPIPMPSNSTGSRPTSYHTHSASSGAPLSPAAAPASAAPMVATTPLQPSRPSHSSSFSSSSSASTLSQSSQLPGPSHSHSLSTSSVSSTTPAGSHQYRPPLVHTYTSSSSSSLSSSSIAAPIMPQQQQQQQQQPYQPKPYRPATTHVPPVSPLSPSAVRPPFVPALAAQGQGRPSAITLAEHRMQQEMLQEQLKHQTTINSMLGRLESQTSVNTQTHPKNSTVSTRIFTDAREDIPTLFLIAPTFEEPLVKGPYKPIRILLPCQGPSTTTGDENAVHMTSHNGYVIKNPNDFLHNNKDAVKMVGTMLTYFTRAAAIAQGLLPIAGGVGGDSGAALTASAAASVAQTLDNRAHLNATGLDTESLYERHMATESHQREALKILLRAASASDPTQSMTGELNGVVLRGGRTIWVCKECYDLMLKGQPIQSDYHVSLSDYEALTRREPVLNVLIRSSASLIIFTNALRTHPNVQKLTIRVAPEYFEAPSRSHPAGLRSIQSLFSDLAQAMARHSLKQLELHGRSRSGLIYVQMPGTVLKSSVMLEQLMIVGMPLFLQGSLLPLKECRMLTRLTLDGVNVDTEEVANNLRTLILMNPGLTHLRLNRMSFSKVALDDTLLSDRNKDNRRMFKNLVQLSLADNNLDVVAATTLVTMAFKSPMLTHLDLSDNPRIGNSGCRAILTLLRQEKMGRLVEMGMDGTGVENGTREEIRQCLVAPS